MDLRKTITVGLGVATYPQFMLGRWKGDLKVKWSATAPDMDCIAQCRVGNVGTVEFAFAKTAKGIELGPTNMLFPWEMRKYDEALLDKQGWTNGDPAEIKRQWKANGGKLAIRPLLSLGVQNTKTATGKDINTQYVYNVCRKLAPRVVEQDLVTKQIWNGVFECYRESVTRFTQRSPSTAYCQVAFAEYNEDGTYKRRILLEGPLTKVQ